MFTKERITRVSFYALVLLILILMKKNYLVFHAYAEGFSIAIAILMFVITWNAREYIDNYYLHFIGISYLFVANIDFLHTLGYSGMNVFPDYDFYANQLWVVGRFMESLSFLAGFYFINKSKKFNEIKVILVYSIISAISISSVLIFKIFPECFIEGVGQTPFKIVSEIVIMLVVGVALFLLHKNKDKFTKKIYYSLGISMILTIISELFFTIYTHNYGLSNILGHYVKIISFYLIYRSIVEAGIKRPYEVIFNNLEKKKEQLEISNAEKTKLFSIIAHDLRNPFNGLIGFSEVLNFEYDNLTDYERKDYIDTIYNSSEELNKLTSNLLEWAAINLEKKKLKFQRVNLLENINEALESAKLLAKNKGINIEVECESGLMLEVDKNSLNIVIRNLVTNAIKYSFPNGKIKIKASKSKDETIIEIIDNGQGMSLEEVDRLLFESTYKSKIGTAEEKGTGLGMNIVKEYIGLNKGKLEIESAENKGTTIRVIFPA